MGLRPPTLPARNDLSRLTNLEANLAHITNYTQKILLVFTDADGQQYVSLPADGEVTQEMRELLRAGFRPTTIIRTVGYMADSEPRFRVTFCPFDNDPSSIADTEYRASDFMLASAGMDDICINLERRAGWRPTLLTLN